MQMRPFYVTLLDVVCVEDAFFVGLSLNVVFEVEKAFFFVIGCSI
jgi:hypothetical protein